MEQSILNTIKKMIGPTIDYTYFDTDIIIHINSVLSILNQLGVGTPGFTVSDNTALWSDFVEDSTYLEAVKSYVYLRVKLLFDPPLNSSVIASMEKTISELEWRMNVITENKKVNEVTN